MAYQYDKRVFMDAYGTMTRTKSQSTKIIIPNDLQFWSVGGYGMVSENGLTWQANNLSFLQHVSIIGGVTGERCCLLWDSEERGWHLLPESSQYVKDAIKASCPQSTKAIKDVEPGSIVTYNGNRVLYLGKKTVIQLPNSYYSWEEVMEEKHLYFKLDKDDNTVGRFRHTKSMKITAIHERTDVRLEDGKHRDDSFKAFLVCHDIKRTWYEVEETDEVSPFFLSGGETYYNTYWYVMAQQGYYTKRIMEAGTTYLVKRDPVFELEEISGRLWVDGYAKLLLCVDTGSQIIRTQL